MIKFLNIIFIFLFIFSNGFSQKKKKKSLFPKSTLSSERLEGYLKRISLEENSIVKNISFRNIGPTVMSGRVTDLAVNPKNPSHFYVAYATGGLWETTNNGNSFNPIFDNQIVITIGDIEVDWEKDIIYVGTGEKNSSRSSYSGNGIYKSSNGGKNWEHLGLDDSHHIGRIVLHPDNSDIIWVASLGHLYSENSDRGVYKSIDAGKTWNKTLFVNNRTGAIDIVIDPSNPDILYSAMWEKDRKAWDFDGSGIGSGIYKSVDGGSSWLEVSGGTSGFPDTRGTGRIGLDISIASPNIIYAILDNQDRKPKDEDVSNEGLTKDSFREISEEDFLKISDKDLDAFLKQNRFPRDYNAIKVKELVRNGMISPYALVEYLEDSNSMLFDTPVIGAEVYSSEDSGVTWKKVNEDELNILYFSYGYYFGEIRVDPQDPAKLYVLGVPLLKSIDFGKTWESIDFDNMHGDHQALWVNPNRSGHLIAGNDGGLNISYDDGENWLKYNSTSVGQFYDINVDMKTPYNVYGGFQDNGVWMGPSNYVASLRWHSSGSYPWKSIYGGDGMQTEVDLRDNETVYTGSQFGNYSRVNTRTGERKRITPSHKLGERPYRWNWETPIYLSRHNQDILYMGSNKFHRSLDQGNNFETLSGDLTNGGIKGNVSYGTLTTIIESSIRYGLIYVGSDDGLIHVSKDGGFSWKNISGSLPEKMWVSGIYPSNFHQNRVYVSLNGYRWDNFDAMIYVSDDYGTNWSKIGHNLPKEPVNVIIEDLENEKLVYVGTDHGVYASLDYGNKFFAFSSGLSNSPVHDLVIHPREKDLVVGTHGRSIYVAGVKHLQMLNEKILIKNLHLFKVDKLKFNPRWGSRGWGSNYLTPNLELVFYSKLEGKTEIIIYKDDVIKKSIDFDANMGLNFINYDLSVDTKKKSTTDNGIIYLKKGDYHIEIIQGENSSKEKLIIN
ncbi:MAG: glycosyl hydrolase [Bacteroidota bacterium]|nr:glycosyl hydrolase [Bacteroidota bacterium]